MLELVCFVPAVSAGSCALRAVFSPTEASHLRVEITLANLDAPRDAAVDKILDLTSTSLKGNYTSSSWTVLVLSRDVGLLRRLGRPAIRQR